MILKAVIKYFKSFHSDPAAKINTGDPIPYESEDARERKRYSEMGFAENGEVNGSLIVAWYNLGKSIL